MSSARGRPQGGWFRLVWTHVDRGSKPRYFVDVINGWPLTRYLLSTQFRGHTFMTSTRKGFGSRGRKGIGGGRSAPCGRPHGKLEPTITSSCLRPLHKSWRIFYQNFVFG